MNSDGEEYWQLTRNKRLSVGSFGGKTNINLREYFEKDGKWLPTKKGITLNLESWEIFKRLIDDVDEAIREKEGKK